MRDTLPWQRLLETALTAEGQLGAQYSQFYKYSYLNEVYLRMQGIHEPVATYARWKAIGRQVLKGAKAKEIIRPIYVTHETEEGDTEQRLVGFKPVRCIFTLSETTGADLPATELPAWDLVRALGALGIREVPFESLNGNVQGYSHGTEFAINPIAVRPNKTRFHELAHIILGHTLQHHYGEYATHRGIMEFQAEAVAYLAMNELGQLDEETASTSRGYIQHWLRDERPPDQAIREVFTATDLILKAGRIGHIALDVAGVVAPNFGE
jgi:hypothetical protein